MPGQVGTDSVNWPRGMEGGNFIIALPHMYDPPSTVLVHANGCS